MRDRLLYDPKGRYRVLGEIIQRRRLVGGDVGLVWSLLGVGAALMLLPVIWIHRSRTGEVRLQRLGITFAILSMGALGLGIYWLPPLEKLAEVEQASRSFSVQLGKLTCAEAADAMNAIGETSVQQIQVVDGDLKIAAALWNAMTSDQQAGLMNVYSQHRACLKLSGEPTVRDRDTGTVLLKGNVGKRL